MHGIVPRMNPPAPTIHQLDSGSDAASLVRSLTSPDRERSSAGVHVVVHVTDGGNNAYARIADAGSAGDGSQRWLHHARRGASPGGWSEQHHQRSEQHVGAWKTANAAALDRMLIDCSKQAWKLDAAAPYVVEFPVVELDEALG
jgi:hypothetical protein